MSYGASEKKERSGVGGGVEPDKVSHDVCVLNSTTPVKSVKSVRKRKKDVVSYLLA